MDSRARRVSGLRREEVALLAGVSTDYYARLEQGRRITPSASVMDALARALDLDPAGRDHLQHLVGPVSSTRRRPATVQRVRPGLHQLLDSLTGQPAFITGRRTDVLASNRLAKALLTDFERFPARERNLLRWMVLNDEAKSLFANWAVQTREVVGTLRLDAGRNPDDRALAELVGELAVKSDDFRQWWAEHHVFQRTYGSKLLRHPLVGELTIDYEALMLPGDPDQTLFVYSTEPGSASEEAMSLLASWTLEAATRS